MGNKKSKGSDNITNNKDIIDNEGKEKIKPPIKIILLGAYRNGKSTIFRQLEFLYRDIDEEKMKRYRIILMDNLMSATSTCLSKITLDENKMKEYSPIKEYYDTDKIDIQLIKKFWKDTEISEKYSRLFIECKIPTTLAFPEQIEFMLEKIDEIEKEVSFEGMLRSSITTSGITAFHPKMDEEREINVFDMGGKRNERKKWMHTFDNVSLVIFTVSLTNFFKILVEDEQTNAMKEDLALWREIAKSKWFVDSKMLLWFSHLDQFEIYLEKNIGLFKEFIGNLNGEQEEITVEKAIELITKKFSENVEVERTFGTVSCNLLDTVQFFEIIKEKMKSLFDVEVSEPKNYGPLVSKKWNPENHKYYSETFKRRVETFLFCMKVNEKRVVKVPKFVLYEIIKYFH